MRPDGGAEPTEDYVFFSVEKFVKFRWRRSSILAVTVAEFGGCSMMYSGGVIFRMRMPQLTIKVKTQWGTVCENLHFFQCHVVVMLRDFISDLCREYNFKRTVGNENLCSQICSGGLMRIE